MTWKNKWEKNYWLDWKDKNHDISFLFIHLDKEKKLSIILLTIIKNHLKTNEIYINWMIFKIWVLFYKFSIVW